VSAFEPWFTLAEAALRPPVALWFNWRMEGLERVPREGPALVAANHISYFDPLAHAYFLVRAGRHPRFLAKRELFGNPFVAAVLRGAKQIPVDRGSGSEAPVRDALTALASGEAVVVYPEATVTSDAGSMPMAGKTGIARLALAAGMPVLPVAVWGSQRVWQRQGRGDLRFGRPIWVKAGPLVDLSPFGDAQEDGRALRQATAAVMDALRDLVVDLRARYPARWS
jgi:1-acyl-sn-glycerol-3-phosphate acyltransferase